MERVTQKYRALMARPLDEARRPIAPLVVDRDHGHTEYSDEIADFSLISTAHTNRLLEPYSAKDTHGPDVYDGFVSLINSLGVTSVLDLGCGSGELLEQLHESGIPKDNLYGCTIHIGECKKAIEEGIPNVAPIDMREITQYYAPSSFDCITTFWGFNHISFADRVEVIKQVYEVLRQGGYFVAQDYFQDPTVAIPDASKFLPFTLKGLDASPFGTVVYFRKQYSL